MTGRLVNTAEGPVVLEIAGGGSPVPVPPPSIAMPQPAQALESALTDIQNLIQQTDHELARIRRVKEQRKLVGVYRARRETLAASLRIVQAGFAPFNPIINGTWYIGFLSKPPHVRGNYKLYSRAMPDRAIDAYDKAKALKLFDLFTIHSPDANIFRDVPPRIVNIDPILVGWLKPELHTDDGNLRGLYRGEDTQSFLIAQWDLAKDIAFSPLLLGAPKE